MRGSVLRSYWRGMRWWLSATPTERKERKLSKQKVKNGDKVCLCADPRHHSRPNYEGSFYGLLDDDLLRPTQKGYPFAGICAKGIRPERTEDGNEITLGISWGDYKRVTLRQEIADFYMLDALASGMFAGELFPRLTRPPQEVLWRRQPLHPDVTHNPDGLMTKPCGCDVSLGESNLLNACEHDGELSDRYWRRVTNGYNPASYVGGVVKKAAKMQRKQVKRLKPIFLAYGLVAFASEMYYFGELSITTGRHDSMSSILGALEVIYNELGPVFTFEEIERCFDPRTVSWESAYGGEAWYNATHVYTLHAQKKLKDKLFVDRVFNLQHNTGSFLSKVSWNDYPGNAIDVLEAHKLSKWRTLHKAASTEVQKLVDSYWDALNAERAAWNLPVETPYHTMLKYEWTADDSESLDGYGDDADDYCPCCHGDDDEGW